MVGLIIMTALICVTIMLVFGGVISTIKDQSKEKRSFYKEMLKAVEEINMETLEKYDIRFTMMPKEDSKED